MASYDVEYPKEPNTRLEMYLDAIYKALNGNAEAAAYQARTTAEGAGVYRFSTSDVSSQFSGESTELYRENLIGGLEPQLGSIALFPDDKSLVLYMGNVTEVNGESYTVSDVAYVNSVWQPSGDWISGVIANYPEVYRYNGGTWLCLGRDLQTAPTEQGKEWFLISESTPHPVYFKISGDAMTDTGGVGTSYTIALSNITPVSPNPVIGDVVIFYTDTATYIGTVTDTQESAIVAEVKMGMNGAASA